VLKDLDATIQACVRVADFEVLAMAAKVGLPLNRVVDVINDSTGQSGVSQYEMPKLFHDDPLDRIQVLDLLQSIRHVIKAGAIAHVPMPLATQTQSMLVAAHNLYPQLNNAKRLAQAIAQSSGALLRDDHAVPPDNRAKASSPHALDTRVVGVIGLGVMGAPLARRALHVAKAVYVHDIHPEHVRRLIDVGAKPCTRLDVMARHCDVMLMCVPGTQEVRAAIFGEQGLLAGLSPGKMIVDQTTGSPAATRQLSSELKRLEVSLIDAPIAGGPQGVENGAFLSFLGGDGATPAVAQLLQAMGSKVVHFGASGNGHAAKLVKNALAICHRFIVYEGLALAIARAIPIDAVAAAVQSGPGQTAAMQRVVQALHSGKPSATIRLALLAKDLGLICDMALDNCASMSIAGLVRAGVIAAVKELGEDANIDDIGQMFGLCVPL